MSILTIDFHTDFHLIQATDDTILIFPDEDTSKPGIEIEVEDLRRILKIVDEELVK